MTEGSTAGDGDVLPDADEDWTQAAQRHYDPEVEELTTAIIFTIADAAGVDPGEVKSPPLYECIDAPALENTFFGPNVVDVSRRGTGLVRFQYNHFLVTVRSDGWIRVFEPAEASSPG